MPLGSLLICRFRIVNDCDEPVAVPPKIRYHLPINVVHPCRYTFCYPLRTFLFVGNEPSTQNLLQKGRPFIMCGIDRRSWEFKWTRTSLTMSGRWTASKASFFSMILGWGPTPCISISSERGSGLPACFSAFSAAISNARSKSSLNSSLSRVVVALPSLRERRQKRLRSGWNYMTANTCGSFLAPTMTLTDR